MNSNVDVTQSDQGLWVTLSVTMFCVFIDPMNQSKPHRINKHFIIARINYLIFTVSNSLTRPKSNQTLKYLSSITQRALQTGIRWNGIAPVSQFGKCYDETRKSADPPRRATTATPGK
jgi:hypothetical protein